LVKISKVKLGYWILLKNSAKLGYAGKINSIITSALPQQAMQALV